MSDEEWVEAAMMDDSVVAELLLRLKQASLPPPKLDLPAPPLHWSVRQRRSKPMILPSKKPASTRDSPTTPLSWSGATSFSGGGIGAVDGYEESSRPIHKRSDLSRSKVIGRSETTSTKRPRKKKTLAELKEDEVLLLKERKHLKRELASLRVTLEKQRTENESLNRMKLDLQCQPEGERVKAVTSDEAFSDEAQQKVSASDPPPLILAPNVTGDVSYAVPEPTLPNSCFEMQEETIDHENKFVLPDLNLPIEEDLSSEVL